MISFTFGAMRGSNVDKYREKYFETINDDWDSALSTESSRLVDNKTNGKSNKGSKVQQVGGSHYSSMAIDVYEFAHANNLDGFQMNVIKYVCRFRAKNGLEDLRKAIGTLERLIELEYSDEGA